LSTRRESVRFGSFLLSIYILTILLRAEYMLDVIGAGATAKSIIDWYSVWSNSPQSAALQTEIERIHREGRQKPAVETALHTEFATPWIHQTWELLKRDMQSHYRNPTYLMAKFTLSIFAGLFIGFSFFKSKDSQQGTQNKLFVSHSLPLPLQDSPNRTNCSPFS